MTIDSATRTEGAGGSATSSVRAANPTPHRAIFLVSHSTPGGAQEIWANLAEGLRLRGHAVMLAALYPGDTAQNTAPNTPWTYALERKPSSFGAKLAMAHRLARLFDAFEADVVFTALPAANVLAPIAALLARRPVHVVTSHHTPSNTYNPALNLLDGLTGSLGAVVRIVGVSETVQRSHAGKLAAYRAKLLTIKNALPLEVEAQIAGLAGQRFRDRAAGRQVVAIGRLAYQKNYPVLIRAAVHMPDVTIRIVGEGPDEAALKALARELGVAERVEFLGFHPRKEALNILAGGDVFVQPSLFEGHSLALIEAAKLGLPLVVSDAQVQIEGISAPDGALCGAVAGVHDDRALAREILHLLDDPDHYAAAASRAAALGAAAAYDTMITAYEGLLDRA
ncbi:glycosyltransferase family 4 protein [Caulobacter sp. Root1472]|uniref:glycosyltransferase family 4 protein n=1 Tax=Caulobacter sp. Root1472 TaxID=1736470 RepID=UPI00350ED945